MLSLVGFFCWSCLRFNGTLMFHRCNRAIFCSKPSHPRTMTDTILLHSPGFIFEISLPDVRDSRSPGCINFFRCSFPFLRSVWLSWSLRIFKSIREISSLSSTSAIVGSKHSSSPTKEFWVIWRSDPTVGFIRQLVAKREATSSVSSTALSSIGSNRRSAAWATCVKLAAVWRLASWASDPCSWLYIISYCFETDVDSPLFSSESDGVAAEVLQEGTSCIPS